MDHERVTISSSHISCGVMELSRINEDTDGVLYAVASRLYHPSRGTPCAAFIWSDVTGTTASSRLSDQVIRNNFGKIELSSIMENPKTGNIIINTTWIVDHERFKKWYASERVKKLGKVGS